MEHKLPGATIFPHNYQAKVTLFSWWTFVVPRNKNNRGFPWKLTLVNKCVNVLVLFKSGD